MKIKAPFMLKTEDYSKGVVSVDVLCLLGEQYWWDNSFLVPLQESEALKAIWEPNDSSNSNNLSDDSSGDPTCGNDSRRPE